MKRAIEKVWLGKGWLRAHVMAWFLEQAGRKRVRVHRTPCKGWYHITAEVSENGNGGV